MNKDRFTIKDVAVLTGLEESEIRYFENVFGEFLTFSQTKLDKNEFTADHLVILKRIKELVRFKGLSIDQVRAELKRALAGEPDDATPSPFENASARCALPADGAIPGASPDAAEGSEDGPAEPSAIQRLPTVKHRLPKRARVIAITSGKGGVGKTTVAANLAILYARMNLKVAIVDADLGLANVHILMGVRPKLNMRHVLEDGYSLEDITVEGPYGVKIVSGGQGVREMANLTAEYRRKMLRHIDELEKRMDVVIIDTGAGISENVLRFATFADETVVVTTPNIASAADGYSIIKILHEMEPELKIGVVTNFVDDEAHSSQVFDRLNGAVRKYLGMELTHLGHICQDPQVMTANQTRKPFVVTFPRSQAAWSLYHTAKNILEAPGFRRPAKDSQFSDLSGALRRTSAAA